jgi:hypothetical protein
MPEIISRAQARAIGQVWYFTGEPCAHGHVSKRNTCNWECRECLNVARREKRALNRVPRVRKVRVPVALRPRKSRQLRLPLLKRRVRNPAWDRSRYHNDPIRKAECKRRALEWSRKNKARRRSYNSQRRAAIKRATPPWLTEGHKAQIKAIYFEAASRSGEWHVDHIYPLNGENCCGLHVPWNLQIIRKVENLRKGNKIQHQTDGGPHVRDSERFL